MTSLILGRSSQCRPGVKSSQSDAASSIDFVGIFGAGSRVRTRGPLITIQVLQTENECSRIEYSKNHSL